MVRQAGQLLDTFRNVIKRGKSGGYVDMFWMWKDLLDSKWICVTYGCYQKMSLTCSHVMYEYKVQVRVHAIAHRLKSPPSFASSLPRVNIACESIIGGWFIQPPLSPIQGRKRMPRYFLSIPKWPAHSDRKVVHQRQTMLLNWWWI